jgi:hypothetical protein
MVREERSMKYLVALWGTKVGELLVRPARVRAQVAVRCEM